MVRMCVVWIHFLLCLFARLPILSHDVVIIAQNFAREIWSATSVLSSHLYRAWPAMMMGLGGKTIYGLRGSELIILFLLCMS